MAEPVYPSDLWQKRYMRQLAAQIREAKVAYYNRDGGTVDDATYDLMWTNLLFLESAYPHLKEHNSPTDIVGAPTAAEPAEPPRRLTLAEMRT
jgi:DNA ligase (NAD+)